MKPPRIILLGGKGRMGIAVQAAAVELGLTIAATVSAQDDLAAALDLGDVVVDFSSPKTTPHLLELAVKKRKPLVIGTTGHDATAKLKLLAQAAGVPTVWAGNFSVGVNLLFALTSRAARTLDDRFDVELVEMHHRHKQDAPSGTATRLLELIMEARALGDDALRHGRSGITGERSPREIGVHAVRGGDVVGEHSVIFAGPGERLELTHKASDRMIFARGALRAALWVVQQQPGVYDMQDVLGLKA
ncbi:MAG: 4-hydroxy-tetrahydrodipicolinate reductase [Candidatus Didemnitutus sp.]|nr:4-hydroxy-tetrahydrodipicolinate reductase [Candidatus Didemnitutus sp.]